MVVSPLTRVGAGRRTANVFTGALRLMSWPHHPDRYLELLDPLLTTQSTRARIVDVDRTVPGMITLTLRPGRRCRFEAGQHIQFGVVVDGVRHTRCYSPSNSQHADDRIVLTVRAHPDGVVSRYLHESAEPGDVVDLGPAAGDFVLPPVRSDRLLLISGGSGITPVLSMLHTLADERHTGAVTFLHYARTAADVPQRARLDELAARANVEVVLAHTRGDGGHLHGRFCREHLDAVVPWFPGTATYACGPAGLTASVREVYRDAGAEQHLRTEEFTLPAVTVAGGAEGTVSFTTSGVVADNTGRTLLEQAESAGLRPDHGCRMGICHTCTTVRRSGCTRDVRTGELDSEPDARIRICVNAPVGDVAVDL
ncbi:ferredoxin reductase [Rhodococcus phenolicus]|uniref:ferredoxin reductase n=1 Tax=Rhodococcus phenolicus TaxID=263849 RepID=UPI00083203BB|nr:FAD-binding oxidoreductase [Rhodococcus phenolicus]